MSRRISPVRMAVSSAVVIAWRLPIMWRAMMVPNASSRAEMTKMIVEKQMAIAEAGFAMQLELVRTMLDPWAGTAAAERIVEAALKPAARRVNANARRLRRRRPAGKANP